jgi:aminopeptidase N
VFANAGAQGYYRTEYAPDALRALAPNVQSALTPAERLVLVADEWALVRADRHSAADYLTLAAGYGGETSSGVLAEVAERLEFISEYLTTAASRPRFQAFVRTMMRPLFDDLGVTPSSTEPDERRQLRAVVVGALGSIGEDEDIVRQARQAVDQSLAARPDAAPIDPTLRDSLVHIAAANGDLSLYERLLTASQRAQTPGERNLYLSATAEFRDPAIIDRALRRALSTDIRAQDTARYLTVFFDNPVARPRAWEFVKNNWAELEPKLRGLNASAVVVRSLQAFCDGDVRDDISSFFGTRRIAGISGALGQTLERIDNCVELRQKQTAPVGDWLERRK